MIGSGTRCSLIMTMNSFTSCVFYCLIVVLIFLDTKVAAQEGPGIVIAHPGQDVELLCNVTVTSGNQAVEWLVNNMGPYRINALRNGILAGHTTTLGSNNLIVENIMMNDSRNDSDYRCVIVPAQGMITFADIIDESDPTILYVAGIPEMVPNVTVDDDTININGDNVTLTLSWEEPFNNLDPIVNYIVSCSGDVICSPNFTTTDNTTRSYTFTNLTPMTNYTFSVVATNSIGSGEAGVMMITTPPSENMTTTTTTTTTASSVGMTTTTPSVGMTTTTSSVGMITTTSSVGMTTTTITSSVGMTTTTSSVGMIATTSSVGMTTTTASSVGMTTTAASSVGMTTTTTTASSVSMTTTTTTTSSVSMTTTTSSVGMTTTTSSVGMTTTTTASVGMTTTTTPSVGMTTTPSVGMTTTSDSNGAVIIPIVVVIVVLILCCFVIINILFCYCCKRREQYDQNNEEDKIAHYSLIVLGILTCGTSVILWWLYKECCGSKEKYNVEGHSAVPLSSTTTKSSKKNSRKDKKVSSKSVYAEMTEAASIQGSPTEVTYAETTKVFNGGTHTGPALHYDYARTGVVKIIDMPDVDDSTQQPAPSEPIMESYAVTEIIPAKDKKKDKKAKTDTKNQQPLEYAVVDKRKKGKKDTKPQKPEINYMDPTNLEFAEEPRNRTLSFDVDHTVQYADLAGSPKYTNI